MPQATLDRPRQKNSTVPRYPQTMRAMAIDKFGSPHVLKMHNLPVPGLAPNEVLIAVHTAGVGSWDAEIRAGWWPDKKSPQFPVTLGSDGSGVIAGTGSRVKRFQVGNQIYGFGWNNRKGGFYAEYVALAEDKVALIPSNLDLEQAGGAAVIGLTALQGIEALSLKHDERILIHGASGAVGSAALQFARGRQAQVFATASGKDGVRLANELGAQDAVDGKRKDVSDALRDICPEGFDAIFATTGDRLQDFLKLLRPKGRLAYPNGIEPAPKKKAGIKVVAYDGTAGRREFERLNQAIQNVSFQVPIGASFPLSQAAKAQELAQKGHVVGKVILRVNQ